jgi:uncharacterized membrane protein YwzB
VVYLTRDVVPDVLFFANTDDTLTDIYIYVWIHILGIFVVFTCVDDFNCFLMVYNPYVVDGLLMIYVCILVS